MKSLDFIEEYIVPSLEPSLSPPLTAAPCLGEAQQQTTSATNTHTLKKCLVATLVPQ